MSAARELDFETEEEEGVDLPSDDARVLAEDEA